MLENEIWKKGQKRSKMTFLGLKMIIFDHFSRFLASFHISFSSLQHPIYDSMSHKLHKLFEITQIITIQSHPMQTNPIFITSMLWQKSYFSLLKRVEHVSLD